MPMNPWNSIKADLTLAQIQSNLQRRWKRLLNTNPNPSKALLKIQF